MTMSGGNDFMTVVESIRVKFDDFSGSARLGDVGTKNVRLSETNAYLVLYSSRAADRCLKFP